MLFTFLPLNAFCFGAAFSISFFSLAAGGCFVRLALTATRKAQLLKLSIGDIPLLPQEREDRPAVCHELRRIMQRRDTVSLTVFYCPANYLHPFREDSGRTHRVFLTKLVQNAGYDLDWAVCCFVQDR